MKKARRDIEIAYTYSLYGKACLYRDDETPVFAVGDPFWAHWKAEELARKSANFVFVTSTTKYVNKEYIYHIDQARLLGVNMQIRDERERYDAVVLYAEQPTEFFTDSIKLKYPEFNLWQAIHKKHKAHIIDFTCTYDSTMMLSMFGNRLGLRLDKGPELIAPDRKDALASIAHFALVWKSEKNNFF